VPDAAVGATAVYANFIAFKYLNDSGTTICKAFTDPNGATFLHYIAKGNAVTILKFHLAGNPVKPKAVTAAHKWSFLHWAANFGAYEVVRFWIKNLEQTNGLDVHDDANKFPDAIAGARGIYPVRKTKGSIIADVNPLYALLLEATNRAADAATAAGVD
jgi:hypothetical protein